MHYKQFSGLNINGISVLIPAGYLMTSRVYILIAQLLFLPVSMLLSVCLICRHLTVADLLVSSSQLLLFCGTSRYLYAEQQCITSVCSTPDSGLCGCLGVGLLYHLLHSQYISFSTTQSHLYVLMHHSVLNH